jgi:hypothetical protein
LQGQPDSPASRQRRACRPKTPQHWPTSLDAPGARAQLVAALVRDMRSGVKSPTLSAEVQQWYALSADERLHCSTSHDRFETRQSADQETWTLKNESRWRTAAAGYGAHVSVIRRRTRDCRLRSVLHRDWCNSVRRIYRSCAV